MLPTASDGNQCIAINFVGTLPDNAWDPNIFRIFRRVIVRNNVIRYMNYPDGTQLPGNTSDTAVQLIGCEYALVEQNTIDLQNPYPIYHLSAKPSSNIPACTTVKYFSNQTPGGALIRGALGSDAQRILQDEPATIIEDALALLLV